MNDVPIVVYDEASHLERLEQLPTRSRVVFALLTACRMLPAYQRFHERTGRGDAAALDELAERLWLDVTGTPMSSDEVDAGAARCLELIPLEEDGWDPETQPYAENAATALTCAFRARQDGDPQHAVWAAQCAYEILDHHVFALLGKPKFDAEVERAVLANPLVQAELTRQHRDLEDLAHLHPTGDLDAHLPVMRERTRQAARAFFGSERGAV